MTLVVNLFAGPGTGKSTTAAGVFYRLKQAGVNCEIAHEFAKDLVWEQRHHTFDFQEYIAAKQIHRIQRLIDQVDVVITDSPVLFGLVYDDGKSHQNALRVGAFHGYVRAVHSSWTSLNFLLTRDPTRPYSRVGRNQNEVAARELDYRIERMLDLNSIPHERVRVDKERDRHLGVICAKVDAYLSRLADPSRPATLSHHAGETDRACHLG